MTGRRVLVCGGRAFNLQGQARKGGIVAGDRWSDGHETLLSDLLIILDRYNLLPEAYEYE